MFRFSRSSVVALAWGLLSTTLLCAQPPGGVRGPGGGGPGGSRGRAADPAAAVARLLTLDADGDGQLTIKEVNDVRLNALLERADENKDGVATKAELTARFTAEAANGGGGFGPGAGPGGDFGPGGPGGMSGRPGPGEVLPAGLQERLQLTPQQREKVAALQRHVDSELKAILTAEQQTQLDEVRTRGPGGRPGGFGPPPDGNGPPGGGARPQRPAIE